MRKRGLLGLAAAVAVLFSTAALVSASVAEPSSALVDTLRSEVEASTGQSTDLAFDSGPSLSIDEPTPGEQVCGSVEVIGSAAGQDLVPAATVEIRDRATGRIVRGPTVAQIDDYGSFSHAVDLPEGDYVAVAAVAAEDGKATSSSVEFSAKAPMTLSIGRPADGATVESVDAVTGSVRSCAADVAEVTVRVEDGDGTTVWKGPAQVDRSWSRFSASVDASIPPGSYTVVAEAADGAGNTITARVSLTVERSSDLQVDNPSPGQTLTGLDRVYGSASASAVDHVAVAIQGEDGRVAASTTATVDPEWGDWSAQIDANLDAGSYTLVAEAVDAGGATLATREVAFTVETSVSLRIDRPSEGAELSALSAVEGSIAASETVDAVAVRIESAGGGTVVPTRQASLSSGAWSVQLSGSLPPGDYRAVAIAEVGGLTVTQRVAFSILDGSGGTSDAGISVYDPLPGTSRSSLSRVCGSATTAAAPATGVEVAVVDDSGSPVGRASAPLELAATSSGDWCASLSETITEPGSYGIAVELVLDTGVVSDLVPFDIDDTLSGTLQCASDEILATDGSCVPLDETFSDLGELACQDVPETDLSTCPSSDDGAGCRSGAEARVKASQAGGEGHVVVARDPIAEVRTAVVFAGQREDRILCVDKVDAFPEAIDEKLKNRVAEDLPDGYEICVRFRAAFQRASGRKAQTMGGGFEIDRSKCPSEAPLEMFHYRGGDRRYDERSGWEKLERCPDCGSTSDGGAKFRTPSLSPFAVAYDPESGGGGGPEEETGSTQAENASKTDDPANGTEDPPGDDGTGDDGSGDGTSSESTGSASPFEGGDPLGRFVEGRMPWWLYVGVFVASIAVGGAGWWLRRGGSDPSEGMPEPTLESFDEGSDDER